MGKEDESLNQSNEDGLFAIHIIRKGPLPLPHRALKQVISHSKSLSPLNETKVTSNHQAEIANLVPSQTLNQKWIEVVKQLVEGVCQNTQMGDACQCVSKIHTESASIVNDAWAQAVGVEKPDFEFLVQIPAKGQGQGSQTKSPYSVHAVEVSDAGYFSRMENN